VVSALLVVLTVEVFDAKPSAMGYLDAIIGIGSVIGGLVLLRRAEKLRVGRGLAVGTLGWGVPIVVMGALDQPVVIIVALVVIGLADPLAMLGTEIIPQRLADDAVLSRVHAALRATQIGVTALGSLVAPLLLHLVGLPVTLLVVGGVVTVSAVWSARAMPGLDARFAELPEAALLRAVPVFAPMSPVALAALARRVEYAAPAAGEAVVREGEPGELFYVIVDGEVEVTQGTRLLRRQTAGEFFGEIALLRDIPRTATVTATRPTRLLTVSRADFLATVGGQLDSRTYIEDVATHRQAF
ncbi:MAG: cyclic nucleotide-binding domain-containing protein, partial [Sporichthyaceae bacterium]